MMQEQGGVYHYYYYVHFGVQCNERGMADDEQMPEKKKFNAVFKG